jgi:4-amino-4-deoxy-L-arabinose transferase-like glycosyltransferase
MPRFSRRQLAVLGLVGLAAGLRLLTLTWRSLDGDEGASLYFSSLSWSELWVRFADLSIERHPLLYYLLLKGWRSLAGEADLALRLPSALAGVLTVALVYRLVRQSFGWPAAAVAALIVALNPLVIFQNQDVRMYAPGLLFSVLAVWALWTALRCPRPRALAYLALFVVAMTLAAYHHLVAGMLLPGIGLMVLLELRRAGRVGWLAVGALAVVAGLYAPYLWNVYLSHSRAAETFTAEAWVSTLQGAASTLLAFRAPVTGPAWSWVWPGLIVLLMILSVGRGRREGAALVLWFLPGLVLTAYTAMRIQFFQPKTFVFAAVPLALLGAVACLGRARSFHWGSGLAAIALVAWQAYGLAFMWRPGYQHEDFRTAARFVSLHATPEDAVVLHLTWYRYVFAHYFPRPFAHPFANNITAEHDVAEGLQPFLEAEVVWLVQAGVDLPREGGDPGRLVERWLAARYPVVTEVFPSGVDVKGFGVNYRLAALPLSATPTHVAYPNGLTLVGFRLPERQLPVHDTWLHPPSTWVHVTLYWSVARPLIEDNRVAVTLEDEGGNVWGGELPRSNDLRAFYPPLRWQPGEVIRQDVDVNTNPSLTPGAYKVVLRVFTVADGTALLTPAGEDWLILDSVALTQ